MSVEHLRARHGVITLSGYGIGARVDRGHLLLEDGIGTARRSGRFARIGHGIRRLVVIGADGMLSLAALRWLADQDAAFVMLERSGKLLAATGPVRPSDVRIRRAQARALDSGAALYVARELIARKLQTQEQVARHQLNDEAAAGAIRSAGEALQAATAMDRIRLVEAKAASAYWQAWRAVPISFPTKDLPRVPDHWKSFGGRISPLTGSPRLAASPANAMLNYLYAVLEAEARLAAAALGLDPGLGFLHTDTKNRDSLAADLMEPVRPLVDRYVLDWIARQPLKRAWFFEQRNGNCRLMAPLAAILAETSETWARAVAPYAEWVARTLWRQTGMAEREAPATRLTQEHKRAAKGATLNRAKPLQAPDRVCRSCGGKLNRRARFCAACAARRSKDNLIKLAKAGRLAAQSPEAQAKRSEAIRRQNLARRGWLLSRHPVWLDGEVYSQRIQPRLAGIAYSEIADALGVSLPYAAAVRAGKRVPHPRHWVKLAEMVSVDESAK